MQIRTFHSWFAALLRAAPLQILQQLQLPPDYELLEDNSRAVQVRLTPFSTERLIEVGRKVRDLYPTSQPERVAQKVSDALIGALAQRVTGTLGGKVGVAPRLFLKKLVGDVLDRVEEHEAFDPAQHYQLSLSASEMNEEERAAAGVQRSLDDIELSIATAAPSGRGPREDS